MAARLRQLLVLIAVSLAAVAAVRWWSRRGAAAVAPAGVWPPLEIPDAPADTPTQAFVAMPVEAAPTDTPRWVAPNADGSCPDGYPVKANDNSGIYHVPGGRFYGRTRPERCYADPEDAAADGYRPAKA